MWGIIATWRMAVEGISEASHILQEKGDAGDAIETAIKAVEDFPYYKSVGYGGLPNEEMEVELDAAYMDGNTLSIGAVAAIKDFANPDNKKQGRTFESFNARFLDEIDFDAYWGAPHNRARLSSDPGNKFKTEKQD